MEKITSYSFQPRYRIFVKGYGFLPFAKTVGRDTGRHITRNLSSEHSKKPFDHAEQFARNALKTASKKAIQKTAKANDDLIGNKITYRITKVSKLLPKINSETNEEEILRERFIPPELRHKTTDDLRLQEENC